MIRLKEKLCQGAGNYNRCKLQILFAPSSHTKNYNSLQTQFQNQVFYFL